MNSFRNDFTRRTLIDNVQVFFSRRGTVILDIDWITFNKMALRSDITAFFISNIGISLLLISIFSNRWASRQTKDILVYQGLFTKCVDHIHEGGKNLTCKPLPQDAGESLIMYDFNSVLKLTDGFFAGVSSNYPKRWSETFLGPFYDDSCL